MRLAKSKIIHMNRSHRQVDKPEQAIISSNLDFLRKNRHKTITNRYQQTTELIQEVPEFEEET